MNGNNGLAYENHIWKTKYFELWNAFLSLMNENQRIQLLFAELKTNMDNTNPTENGNILQSLQNKNAELMKSVMNKTSEINELNRKIEKYKLSNAPPHPVHIPHTQVNH